MYHYNILVVYLSYSRYHSFALDAFVSSFACSLLPPFGNCSSNALGSTGFVGTISYMLNSIGRNSLTLQKYLPPNIMMFVSMILVTHHPNVIGIRQLYSSMNSRLNPCNVNAKSRTNCDRRTINTMYNTLIFLVQQQRGKVRQDRSDDR